MTLAELKAEHPALFAEVKEIGAKEGAKTEKERIDAWAHFIEADPKAVQAGINSGLAITTAQGFELMEKKFSKKGVADLENDSEKKDLKTAEVSETKTKEELEKEAWKKEVLGHSTGLGKKA